MKLSRDSILAIGLLVALVLVTLLAAAQQARDEAPPPLASFSTEPNGARALALWLDELGYAIRSDTFSVFEVPPEADLVLMLEPTGLVNDAEWEQLDRWVEAGGTLLIAGEGFATALAFNHFDVSLQPISDTLTPAGAALPVLLSPPLTQPPDVRPQFGLRPNRADAVTLLAAGEQPLAVMLMQEKGRVILSSTPFAFSNAGLKEAGNGALALNLISAAPAQAIWFDEWHHGERGPVGEGAIVGPEAWLRRTPAGHALLFSAVAIFVMLLLSGQRFGRPVPLPHEITRRAPLEYITAIANLSRRAGHRQAVLAQYHHRLKRQLGRRYRLDPTLPDAEYVDRLALYRPDLQREALTQLLARLRQSHVSEPELIQLAADVAEWTKEEG